MHRAKISWQKAAFVIWKDRGTLATARQESSQNLLLQSLLSLPTALQALKLQHLDGVDPKVHTFISSHSFKGARIRGRIPAFLAYPFGADNRSLNTKRWAKYYLLA